MYQLYDLLFLLYKGYRQGHGCMSWGFSQLFTRISGWFCFGPSALWHIVARRPSEITTPPGRSKPVEKHSL